MSGAKQRLNGTRRAVPGSKGWSDADAIKALDKRARLDSPDGSLTTWQDQGGMHAQVTPVTPIAPSVTYDAEAEQFTVTMPYFQAAQTDDQYQHKYDSEHQAKFPLFNTGTFVFDLHSSNYIVDFVLDMTSRSVDTRDSLRWSASIDTADACTDALSLQWESVHGYRAGLSRRLWSVTLVADGTHSLDFEEKPVMFAGPAHGHPHTWMHYQPPYSRFSDTVETNGTLTIYGLKWRIRDVFSVYEQITAEIPPGTDDNIVLGRIEGGGVGFGLIDVLHDPPTSELAGYITKLGEIVTDSDGKCTRFEDHSGYAEYPFMEGLTQDVTIDGTTLTFTSGILTAVS